MQGVVDIAAGNHVKLMAGLTAKAAAATGTQQDTST
jgi:hypothetical protein